MPTKATNSLSNTTKKTSIAGYLTLPAVKEQIVSILQDTQKSAQFTSSIVSAVQTNPQLKECTNASIVSAALLGYSLKLSPSPQLGQFYMVPFNNHQTGTKEAQFQLGYHGILQLALRSGQYKKLNVLAIKQGELISYDPLNEDIKVNLIQDPNEREKAPTMGYYAMFEYTNGFRKAIYWSKEQMEAYAERYSMGYRAHKGYTFWEKDFDSMACKTMLKQLISKWGMMSVDSEITKAIEDDESVVHEDGTVDHIDYVDGEVVDQTPVETIKETTEEKGKVFG